MVEFEVKFPDIGGDDQKVVVMRGVLIGGFVFFVRILT
jgi:hypothetical protein